jgi:FkbM family methyltransferase
MTPRMGSLTTHLTPRQQARLLALRWRIRPPEPEVALACRVLSVLGGGVAIDVGANRGQYTLPLARQAQTVHAFEANPELAGYLRQVVPPNVEVHDVALGARPGTATLRVPVVRGRHVRGRGTLADANPFSDLDADAVDATVVRCERLDDVLDSRQPDHPLHLVKIDVEGLEQAVLDGARRILAEQSPLLIVESEARHNADVDGVFECLDAAGYTSMCLHRDGVVRPITADEAAGRRGARLDDRRRASANNFLFAREAVIERLRRGGIPIETK